MYAGRMHAAMQACDKAIALEPLGAELLSHRAFLLLMAGRPQDALTVVKEARAMDPASAELGLSIECIAHLLLGDYAGAAVTGEKEMGISRGDDPERNMWMAAAYAQAGDLPKAAALRDAVLREVPGFTIALHRARSRSLEPAYLELADMHLYAGLRKAGFPEA
jgi:tetratricopeptide (TPR) repeat protein